MRHLLVVFLLLGFTAAVVHAQIPEGVVGTYEPHPEAKKAISELLSPFCPGLMLEQCPAEPSRILRDSIHALAVEGWTAGEIRGWMLANHGEEYRAMPQRSGWALWAWILPPAALLLGLGAVVVLARRMRKPDDPARPAGGTEPDPDEVVLSPEDEARLKDAIRDLELSEDPSY